MNVEEYCDPTLESDIPDDTLVESEYLEFEDRFEPKLELDIPDDDEAMLIESPWFLNVEEYCEPTLESDMPDDKLEESVSLEEKFEPTLESDISDDADAILVESPWFIVAEEYFEAALVSDIAEDSETKLVESPGYLKDLFFWNLAFFRLDKSGLSYLVFEIDSTFFEPVLIYIYIYYNCMFLC